MATAGGVASSTSTIPISYTELRSWAELTGRRPRPWEIELLRAIDGAWLGAFKRGDRDGAER